MTRKEYRNYRRLIRDNGTSAYAWIKNPLHRDQMREIADGQDSLAERAQVVRYCVAQRLAYNFRNLFLIHPHWSGLKG